MNEYFGGRETLRTAVTKCESEKPTHLCHSERFDVYCVFSIYTHFIYSNFIHNLKCIFNVREYIRLFVQFFLLMIYELFAQMCPFKITL